MIKPSGPLVETLLELRLSSKHAENGQINSDDMAAIDRAIAKRYTLSSEEEDQHIHVSLAPNTGDFHTQRTPSMRRVYRNEASNRVFQLTPHVMRVSLLQPYAGWAVMKENFVEEARLISEASQVQFGPQISLHYINQIRVNEGQRPHDFLSSGAFIPQCVVDAQGAFRATIGCYDVATKAHLTLDVGSELAAVDFASRLSGIVLTLSAMTQVSPIDPATNLQSFADMLHAHTRRMFAGSISESAKKAWRLSFMREGGHGTV